MTNNFPYSQFFSAEFLKSSNHLISEQCGDLASIYKDQIGLSIWTPPASEDREIYAKQLASKNFQFKQVLKADEAYECLDDLPNYPGVYKMRKWIAELIDIFATLFGLEQVGLRISSRNAPMCPRFHIDHVPVRLIHSLYGDSCQWAYDPVFLQTENKTNECLNVLEQTAQIRQAPPGSVVIMKGTKWKEGIPPVIHRSPMHKEARVVMTLDFA